MGGKRSKNPKKTRGRLMKYIQKGYGVQFVVVLICILLSAVANVAGSMFLKSLIDDYISPLLLQASPVFTGLLHALMSMAVIYLIGIATTFIYNWLMVSISQGVLKKVRDEMFAHMQKLPIRYFDTHTHGDLMSHFTNDTDTLQQILISEDGKINHFDKVAGDMLTDSIQSIQIAPDGVVTDIYPETGNEAGKIDLIHDKDRGEISRYARDNHTLILQESFQLKQGGSGIAIRNPAYLEDENGKEYFWGFTIVIIRVPDIFSDSVKALSNFGYQYRVSKTVAPWNKTYKEVYSSGGELDHPEAYTFNMGGELWKLEIMPKNGWVNNHYLVVVTCGGALIVLLLTGLTAALLNLDEHRRNLKRLAITDSLTGIYNRQGFEELVEQYMKQNPTKHCIIALLDVDDFKLINDIYGHAAGDKALQCLVESMQRFFREKAVLGRNGGDEFCIFLPDCSYEEIKELIQEFTKMPKYFSYKEEEHTFCISLGYAEYPVYAKDRAQLMYYADVALYEVKLRGKNGCMAYREGLRLENRKQLGFALKDVSENLPGAFIIYKADKIDDEIFFVNSELLRLTGCKTMDEMFQYTKRSFRNLIREDEQEATENSI